MRKITITEYAVIVYTIGICALSLIPSEQVPRIGFNVSDKLLHAVLFIPLGLLAGLSMRKGALVIAVVWIVVIAGISELLQFLAPGRNPDLMDAVFDVGGGIPAAVLTHVVRLKRQGSVNKKNT